MTLATVGADGRPSSRIVLLKGYDARGIVWYTNYAAARAVNWPHPRSPRCSSIGSNWSAWCASRAGSSAVEPQESDAYFASRPLDSRLGAWASPQSEVIASRAVLVANAAKDAAHDALQPPRPPHWGGYRLSPDCWEFWQGRKSRLHDRLRYRRPSPEAVSGDWERERLAP